MKRIIEKGSFADNDSAYILFQDRGKYFLELFGFPAKVDKLCDFKSYLDENLGVTAVAIHDGRSFVGLDDDSLFDTLARNEKSILFEVKLDFDISSYGL
ncbi:hypothetical protein CR969_03505 [Candidatus Saccharibacteria bacterium]|nr:MAG: hypothetical protein CR969_03505 [Candidatus Saccharibacteria bacterium]